MQVQSSAFASASASALDSKPTTTPQPENASNPDPKFNIEQTLREIEAQKNFLKEKRHATKETPGERRRRRVEEVANATFPDVPPRAKS
jgi:hypothetical protein